MKDRKHESVMFLRVGDSTATDNRIICRVKCRFCIWLENQCVIMYFLANPLIAGIQYEEILINNKARIGIFCLCGLVFVPT